jgi:hypothetical protein
MTLRQNGGVLLHYAIIIMVSILIITFIWSDNASYMAREQVYENYYATSIRILTRVEQLEEYREDMKWMFNDIIYYRSTLSEYANGFTSNENETWACYEGTGLTVEFFQMYLGKSITMVNKQEYDEIVNTEEYKNMTTFPDVDSIKIINDTIVVKLNEVVY